MRWHLLSADALIHTLHEAPYSAPAGEASSGAFALADSRFVNFHLSFRERVVMIEKDMQIERHMRWKT